MNLGPAAAGHLTEPPRLRWPTVEGQDSYLAGERAMSRSEGLPPRPLDRAAEDLTGWGRGRRGVPPPLFGYVAGRESLGTLVVRHRLTPDLGQFGGHIGYHVVPPWRRQGHAPRMLAAGVADCRALGLDRVLVTCGVDNEPSRRV